MFQYLHRSFIQIEALYIKGHTNIILWSQAKQTYGISGAQEANTSTLHVGVLELVFEEIGGYMSHLSTSGLYGVAAYFFEH